MPTLSVTRYLKKLNNYFESKMKKKTFINRIIIEVIF